MSRAAILAPMSTDAFERACAAVNGPAALGRLLNKDRGTINHWRVRVPVEHCPAVELATGVSCEELRSDLNWVRIPCEGWPNGKPLLDIAPAEAEGR